MRRRLHVLACVLFLLVLGCKPVLLNDRISGVVLDETKNPIAGAVVRVKATAQSTTTDIQGKFTLLGLQPNESVLLTAWAPGYYIGGSEIEYVAGETNVEIILKKHAEDDNPDYQWVSAFASGGNGGNCENCHADPDDPQAALPFAEWQADAHALSAQNIRFLSMYLGQDVHGSQSPVTRYGFNRDYGRIPLRPDLSQPYYGPGYIKDFPDTAGNCAACHSPAAAINAAYETDPAILTGVEAEGVTCDFCHKVWGVRLNPSTNLPFPNMPGVLSFEFRRPPQGHQFFAGPFDDVAPGEDTYTAIQRQSQYCAPCHFGAFWDTLIYNSFGEWLASAYSEPETGKTCQDCHMPAGQNDHFARIDQGGEIRDPQTIFSHRMPGAADEDLLQNAVSMTVNGRREQQRIVVDVTLSNDFTGHHVPTDSPLRQMILLVKATDGQGGTLSLLSGPTIPEWGGIGEPAQGYYAGLPGKSYAKILSELWTEITPTGAYWNPTRIISDNRIPASGVDSSTYVFVVPDEIESLSQSLSVQVTLLFRRAFKQLMDQKGWEVPDIVMEEDTILLPPP